MCVGGAHREGLEKMERNKQREADRLRDGKARDEKQREMRLAENNVISLNVTSIEPSALLLKSKFVCQFIFTSSFSRRFSLPFFPIISDRIR